jgi:radical SAM protein with 4Fe4S-binding SPASM domain
LLLHETQDVVKQIRELEAVSVVIIGAGEPTIQPDFRELVSFIASSNLIPVVFTNGTGLDKDMVRFLFDHNASVMLKMDCLNPRTQDMLAGVHGASEVIQGALDVLLNSGFPAREKQELRLGISFVSTLPNLDDIPDLWKFCRKNWIYPNHELLILRGRGQENMGLLQPNIEQTAELKTELLRIDSSFGYSWVPYKPLTGWGCLQVLYSVYVACDGAVRPCADIDIPYFNIRQQRIREILESEFFQLVRNISGHLRGKCKHCEFNSECIGCRGGAFANATLRGETPASAVCSEDPFCWK